MPKAARSDRRARGKKPPARRPKPQAEKPATLAPAKPLAPAVPEPVVGVWLNRKLTAEYCEISPQQITLDSREPDFPKSAVQGVGRNKLYDAEAIKAWRDGRGKKGSELDDRAKNARVEKEETKGRRELIAERREELKLAQLEGDLIPRLAVEQFAAGLLTSIGEFFDQEPDFISGECCGECKQKVPARLKKDFDAKRIEIAATLEQHARKLDAERIKREPAAGE